MGKLCRNIYHMGRYMHLCYKIYFVRKTDKSPVKYCLYMHGDTYQICINFMRNARMLTP